MNVGRGGGDVCLQVILSPFMCSNLPSLVWMRWMRCLCYEQLIQADVLVLAPDDLLGFHEFTNDMAL